MTFIAQCVNKALQKCPENVSWHKVYNNSERQRFACKNFSETWVNYDALINH